MSDADRILVRRISNGDEKALEDFYHAYQERVFRFAYSRLNDSFEAGDIVSEVMLEVWRGAGRFEGRSSVSSWVFGIANHKAIDRFRRRPDAHEELDEQLEDETATDPVEVISAGEDAGRVGQCLETLSSSHKAALHMAFFEDMSYSEIAVALGIPEGTVKTRVYHAKRAMLHCLSKLMGDVQ